MRDHLLSAAASVEWAISNLPSFEARLDAWRDDNINVIIEELPAENPNNIIVAREKEPLPLIFIAEAGAYINAIRSSLDILATSLAEHHEAKVREEDIYFPVVASEEVFAGGKYKGSKFVQALPAAERAKIEALKPYKGGNDTLWALHHLDIVRKHFRLLAVESNPAEFRITGYGIRQIFTQVATGWVCNPGETIFGFIKKGATGYQIKFTPYIGINDPGPYARRPLIPVLNQFASTANSIIGLFDA